MCGHAVTRHGKTRLGPVSVFRKPVINAGMALMAEWHFADGTICLARRGISVILYRLENSPVVGAEGAAVPLRHGRRAGERLLRCRPEAGIEHGPGQLVQGAAY